MISGAPAGTFRSATWPDRERERERVRESARRELEGIYLVF